MESKVSPIFLKNNWDLLLDYTSIRIFISLFYSLDLGLIPNEQICEKCHQSCEIEAKKVDNQNCLKICDLTWRCSKCRIKYSVFKDSIFYQNKIDLVQFHLICHFWAA